MKSALLALSVLFAIASPRGSVAHERTEPAAVNLTVSVFNDADVSPSVLSQAQDRAIAIMRRSGVSLTWLDCGTPGNRLPNTGCSAVVFPKHVSLRVVAKVSSIRSDIFGQSFQDASGEGNYALVYFAGLVSSNAGATVPTGELLGCVIAHELGHLLLGKDSHSATGLMSPVWQDSELRQAAQGNLFFTADQGGRIRSRYAAASARLEKTSGPLQASSGE
jgi:hypothetical protein